MTYTTPQVARVSRQTVRTIRHWEAMGLFGKVARDRRGDRVFSEHDLQRAQIISAASMAGMGLDEIKAAAPATLVSAIGGAATFLSGVYRAMDKDFDL